jgi:hypothetical protein
LTPHSAFFVLLQSGTLILSHAPILSAQLSFGQINGKSEGQISGDLQSALDFTQLPSLHKTGVATGQTLIFLHWAESFRHVPSKHLYARSLGQVVGVAQLFKFISQDPSGQMKRLKSPG